MSAPFSHRNADARERINSALVLLADEKGLKRGDLEKWNPSAGDSVPDLERRISEWQALFKGLPGSQ